jgi:hypothetical protein
MSAKTFWFVAAIGVAVIVAGLLFFNAPQPGNVEIQSLEQYYNDQYLVAAAVGLIVGLLFGWLTRGNVYHDPRESAVSYNRRVIARGVVAGGVAIALAFLVACVFAVAWTLDPLAPLEKVTLVVASGLFVVILAIAGVVSLLAFAMITRAKPWSGQYALLPRR